MLSRINAVSQSDSGAVRREQKRVAQERFRVTAKGKDVMSRANDKRRYGLVPGERDAMEVRQNGVCAICGKPPSKRRLHVDHCHSCAKIDKRGSIRGLLCFQCNRGYFHSDPGLLMYAAVYFSRHHSVCPKIKR